MTNFKIHICIESQGDERKTQITLNSLFNVDIRVSHSIYSPEDICNIWSQLSALSDDTYLLFVKEGDKPNLESINIKGERPDLCIFSPDKTKQFPRVNFSPFTLSSFLEGEYNNSNFLIRSDWCRRLSVDTKYGVGWLMEIVISMLHLHNAQAIRINADALTADSPSFGFSIGHDEILMKIIPAKFGYGFPDQQVITMFGAKKRYVNLCQARVRKLRNNTVTLFFKQLIKSKKYRQFFKAATFKSKYADNWRNIPIIINNYNRLEYLQRLIESLEKRNITNIHILDNNSTYPPLLEYYKTTKYTVHHLGANLGYRALWKSEVYDIFKNDYYVYTDPDLVLDEDCPDDFMEYFMSLHTKYSYTWKVGFALSIDDLPEHFAAKHDVQNWERQFWEVEVERDVFHAPIDTTFAIYKPFGISDNIRSLRVAGKYTMKHLPWYIDSDNLCAEEIYYINSCTKKVHWSNLTKTFLCKSL